MRAVQLGQPVSLDTLKIVELEDPSPGPGEILVRWHASSLNFHDYTVVTGLLSTEPNRIPMSDGAGEIVAIGDGVSAWKSGDRVMSLFFPDWQDGKPTEDNTRAMPGDRTEGCATELMVLPEHAVTRIPEGYTWAQAATLPCAGLTAWRALIEGGLKAGDSLLVEGTGGVSIFALQLAKASGATVYATTSSDDKAEKLKALGADVVINYKKDENWGETVFKLSGGGVDHVIDIGGGATINQSIAAAKMGGHLAFVGLLGGMNIDIPVFNLFFKHLKMTGLAVGSAKMQNDMVRAIEANNIEPVIDHSFPLENIADAFRYQESGQHFGKIVLEY